MANTLHREVHRTLHRKLARSKWTSDQLPFFIFSLTYVLKSKPKADSCWVSNMESNFSSFTSTGSTSMRRDYGCHPTGLAVPAPLRSRRMGSELPLPTVSPSPNPAPHTHVTLIRLRFKQHHLFVPKLFTSTNMTG